MKPSEILVVYNESSNVVESVHADKPFAERAVEWEESLRPHVSFVIIDLESAIDRISNAEKNYWSQAHCN